VPFQAIREVFSLTLPSVYSFSTGVLFCHLAHELSLPFSTLITAFRSIFLHLAFSNPFNVLICVCCASGSRILVPLAIRGLVEREAHHIPPLHVMAYRPAGAALAS
jgi:hypothetical protein